MTKEHPAIQDFITQSQVSMERAAAREQEGFDPLLLALGVSVHKAALDALTVGAPGLSAHLKEVLTMNINRRAVDNFRKTPEYQDLAVEQGNGRKDIMTDAPNSNAGTLVTSALGRPDKTKVQHPSPDLTEAPQGE